MRKAVNGNRAFSLSPTGAAARDYSTATEVKSLKIVKEADRAKALLAARRSFRPEDDAAPFTPPRARI